MNTLNSSRSLKRQLFGVMALVGMIGLLPMASRGQQLLVSALAEDVAFSPRGSYVAFMTYTTVVVRLSTTPVKTFALNSLASFAPAFSPDESRIAAVMGQVFAGGLTGSRILTHSVPDGAAIAVLPVAFYNPNRAEITDSDWILLDGKEQLVCLQRYFSSQIKKYSPDDGTQIGAGQPFEDGVVQLSISEVAKRIVAGGETGRIYVWDLDTLDQEIVLTNKLGSSAFGAISKDGAAIFVGAQDDLLESYSTVDWTRLKSVKVNQDGVRELAVDRDRTIVLTRGYDGTAKGWTAGDFRHLFTVPVGEPAVTWSQKPSYRILISPDGSMFATAGRDGQGRLYTIPLAVTSARREGQEMKLEWCGGLPPFRLQQRASLAAGEWEDVPGDLNFRRLSIPLAGTRFYRIVGQPTPEPEPTL